ncbi:ATP-binding protein [Ketobacter alkanivorans]|uniref:histidine kinase n=1 Tax=Ketobacter alkanivorans TaxID=1917421 RepID=A0A2K9LNF8_9GAMM|nr:ATP-binding protein [Ketobacter alkanivorans]AUM13813.1 hypothetical protein Kalk_15865 [Ketobacter alkanivorans]
MLNLNFGQKIFFSVLSVAGVSVLLISMPMLYNSANHYGEIATDHARTDSLMLSNMVAPALVFEREDMVEGILEILDQSPDVVSATVFALNPLDGSLVEFANYGDTSVTAHIALDDMFGSQVQRYDGFLVSVAPILSEQEVVGYIRLVVALTSVREHFQETLIYVLIAVVVSLFVASYLAMTSRRAIVKPIKDLNQVTQLIAETKDYSSRAVAVSEDEVGDLIQSFNAMLSVIEEYDSARKEKEAEIYQLNQDLEKKVDERTIELQNSMNVLNKTISDLRETQNKLVEQEKMASLGSLVAGVAHEINTPIGVGITASSHLSQSVADLQNKFLQGSLTKREFSESVDEMRETVLMIVKNLERSAALVKSFKMVAVDQSSDDLRSFNVKEYFENVLLSLKPKLKRTRHVVLLNVPEDLILYSSPGAMSQIITNLIMNSLIHGFEFMEAGEIEINAQQNGAEFILDYYDNGKGIPEEIQGRIFDPFVTTARNKGGSGLGTHILYNLVTQVLGGVVELKQGRSAGVHFQIRLPINSQGTMESVTRVGAQ